MRPAVYSSFCPVLLELRVAARSTVYRRYTDAESNIVNSFIEGELYAPVVDKVKGLISALKVG